MVCGVKHGPTTCVCVCVLSFQVLQDMGLPTGVEIKTEVKSEPEETSVTPEEEKPVVLPAETTTAAKPEDSPDTSGAAEVQNKDQVKVLGFVCFLSTDVDINISLMVSVSALRPLVSRDQY